MNRSTPGLPVHHHLPEFTQTHVHLVLMPSSHLILGHPLLLLPPIPPTIRVFSNESTLLMRCPKYWSFSFSIILFKEIPGLISFRMDWLDLLAVQGTLKVLVETKYDCNCSWLKMTPVFLWPKEISGEGLICNCQQPVHLEWEAESWRSAGKCITALQLPWAIT